MLGGGFTILLNLERRRTVVQDTENPMGEVEIQQCIQDCLKCNTVCLQTAENYQQAGSDRDKFEHISELQDCAEMCMTAAHFMQHDSPLYGFVCQTCALVCTHCAGECELRGETDCANACRACAWCCDQLAKLVP